MTPARSRAVEGHRVRWGAPTRVVRAPGRVNLIGEHTDYNDGFTLPMALPFDTVVAASDDGDPQTGPVHVESDGFGAIDVAADAPLVGLPSWAAHIGGVIRLLAAAGVAARGWRASIATDIPTGASLSSSAALEVALTTSLLTRAGRQWSPLEVAQLCRRVENEVVGLPSGIMDQFISAGAVAGHASLMDCRELTLTPIRLPADVVVAVMDTGTRRVLADAAYGERQASCARAAQVLGVAALRDASLDQLAQLDEVVDRRRARHVVTENRRTLDAADAMRRGAADELGRLMSQSHASLRDDYEVSAPALDRIVEIAERAPGCLGARMTGGGFAGCAVALVRRAEADAFTATVLDEYRFEANRARVWPCVPGAGATVIAPGRGDC